MNQLKKQNSLLNQTCTLKSIENINLPFQTPKNKNLNKNSPTQNKITNKSSCRLNQKKKKIENASESSSISDINEESQFMNFNFLMNDISMEIFSQSTNDENISNNFSNFSLTDLNNDIEFFARDYLPIDLDIESNEDLLPNETDIVEKNKIIKPEIGSQPKNETLNSLNPNLNSNLQIYQNDPVTMNINKPSLYTKRVTYIESPFDNYFDTSKNRSFLYQMKNHFLNKSDSSFLSSDQEI